MSLFRLLLRLYPKGFRERYRAELEGMFLESRREARYRGRFGAGRFWFDIIVDLVVGAWRQRRSSVVPDDAGDFPRRSEMDTILQDLRDASRQCVRRPGFAAVAVLSLALGIGANSLIYGLVDGFVFHPFPYPQADRFMSIGVNFPKLSSNVDYLEVLSPADYLDIRTARSFAATGAFDLGNRNLSGGDQPERVFTALLLDDLFPVLQVKPALGRGFTRDELAPGGSRPVAIISDRLWRSRFGADPNILNRPIRIAGDAASVVGVMPPGILVAGTDLWLPWGGDPAAMPRTVRQFNVVARLAPGVSAAQANAELATIAAAVDQRERAAFKEYEGWRLVATPFASAIMRDARPAAFLLVGAVALVLLIACANIAGLFLARATSRQRELAVRVALGAGRWRIARHLLTEAALIACAGAAAGLALASTGLKAAVALLPAQLTMFGLEAHVNARVLAWTAALAVVSAALVAAIPAFSATRTDPQDALKADARGAGTRSGTRLRAALVVAEIALSAVLLLGAGLFLRSFANIQRVDRGFDADGVMTMRLTLPRERYEGEKANAFFDRLVERIGALPGVRAVAAASQFPPDESFSTPFTLDGTPSETGHIPTAMVTVASPAYFDTLRVPIRRGRAFSATDRLDAPRVAIVNRAFVDRYLAGSDALGRRLQIGDAAGGPWTIVGVAANVRNAGLTQPVQPELYVPVRQQTLWNQLFVLTRADTGAAALMPALRETVRSLDADQPIYAVQSLEQAIADSSFQQRTAAVLIAVFAAIAMLLAAVGIFGVMSYSVAARTQEIGIRMSVGASRAEILRLVLAQAGRLATSGLLIGLAIGLAGGRALGGMLYGVAPTDPVTLAAVAATLALVAVLAAWVPAARAMRIDPMVALRYE
ncbi:MAG TPA: ABC transporter permease [Vicinamibacterales bacterium]|nr:ABC transporter permease [Vicinamibacterales bacterium]